MDAKRINLPYRLNCEGYFLHESGKVLARDTGRGYIEFPGGGVEGSVYEAIARETLEETGAKITGLKEIGIVYFDWGTDWAKTEKQKSRYQQFRGEKMHLFVGRVAELGEATGDLTNNESGWKGEKLMEIKTLIKLINSFRPFLPEMQIYHEKQLWALSNLNKLL